MKKYLLTAALAAIGIVGYADDTTRNSADFTDSKGYSVQTNSFWKNWFISAGAGAQTLFGDHDKQLGWGDRITPAFDLAVGKWFTPVIGVRGMASGLTLKGAAQDGDFLQETRNPSEDLYWTFPTEKGIVSAFHRKGSDDLCYSRSMIIRP